MKPQAALNFLRLAYDEKRLAQAYILAADPTEVGKPVAELVLQLLFCTKPENRPCGDCAACRTVAQHIHADVLWLEPQKKSRQIGVDEVRDLVRRAQQTSFTGTWKACVISAADRLGREASNALLKTLEEPSGSSLFLLLTDNPRSLLPTIVSRCQTLTLDTDAAARSKWDSALLTILAAESEQSSASPLLAALAKGQEIVALLKMMKEAAEKDAEAAAETAGEDLDADTLDGRARSLFIEMRGRLMRVLLHWHRDRLILACGVDDAQVYFSEYAATLKAQAARMNRADALRHMRVVEDMHDQLERSLPDALVFGYGLPRLGPV